MFARQLVPCTSFVLLTAVFGCGGGDSTEPNDPVAAVTISPATSQLAALGETVQLTTTVRTQGGANANAPVTWQSSAPQIATVDGNGLVRAVANGSAQMTAAAGTVSGTADITVQQVATRVNLTPARDSIFAGATIQLSAAATDRGNAAIAAPLATWSSSDTAIAVVSSTGLVTGRKRGQVRISVRVDTASASTDIIVRLTSILASRDTVITGPLQVDRFEVAAGRTVTLAGDLTLRAEGPVVINGTIRGDCRAVDIVSLQTVTVRGTLDNTCSIATAPGQSLRIVSGAEYALEAATVHSSGSITITNDSTITPDTSSLGASRRVALRTRAIAPANCSLNGAVGLGRTRADGASGSPQGAAGVSPPRVTLICQGDMTVQGLTVKADHGGDGGEGTSTTAGVAARAGKAGDGGDITLASATKVIIDGAQLTAGNGGKGGSASSIPSTTGLAEAIASDGGGAGSVFVSAPQVVFQGNPSRIELGHGGDGGDALAVAMAGTDATLTQAAQQGAEAKARAGIGGAYIGGFRVHVIGGLLSGQVLNAGSLLIRPSVGGNGGNAEVSPGDGGSSNFLPFPHGANGGDGDIFVGGGGAIRLFDNRGIGSALGTPGGTGSGVIRHGNGGLGIPDCVLPIFHLGGDGGSGSTVTLFSTGPGRDALDQPSVLVGKVEVVDALNGRDGRDGVADLSRSLNDLGVVYNGLTRYAEAESVLTEALAIRRAGEGDRDRMVGITASNLGAAYYFQGKVDSAITIQTEAVAALERSVGRDHQRSIVALGNLAAFKRAAGDVKGAEADFRKLLERQTRLQGAEHPVTARVAASLASALYARGTTTNNDAALAEAETLYLGSFGALEKALGSRHAQVAATLDRLGAVLLARGREREALTYQERAVAVMRAANGDSHQSTIALVGGLAVIHWRMRNIPAAQRLQREVAQRYAQALGDQHVQTAFARARLCEFLLGSGYAIAEAQRNCALAEEVQRNGPATNRQAAWFSGLRLAQTHIALGTTGKADSILARLRPALDTLPGEAPARKLLDSLTAAASRRR